MMIMMTLLLKRSYVRYCPPSHSEGPSTCTIKQLVGASRCVTEVRKRGWDWVKGWIKHSCRCFDLVDYVDCTSSTVAHLRRKMFTKKSLLMTSAGALFSKRKVIHNKCIFISSIFCVIHIIFVCVSG